MSKELYEQVREWVKDPQHGSEDYGQLGALPKHIRDTIHKLCDFAESADKVAMEKIKELEELKANQAKIETVQGYAIDDILAFIQGFKSKEITPEILHDNLLMYKKGYENALERVNKSWEDFNSKLMKMDKQGSAKDE